MIARTERKSLKTDAVFLLLFNSTSIGAAPALYDSSTISLSNKRGRHCANPPQLSLLTHPRSAFLNTENISKRPYFIHV